MSNSTLKQISCARLDERDDLARQGIVPAAVMATTTVELCATCHAEIVVSASSLKILHVDPEFEVVCMACAHSMMKKSLRNGERVTVVEPKRRG